MARLLGSAVICLSILITGQLSQHTSQARATTPSLHTMTLGMGYVPSVQFTPLYVADARGYYREAGLNVVFSYASSPNLLQLVGAGHVDLANADATDVIIARSHGIPLKTIFGEYQKFPVAIFSLARKNIRKASDLCGKLIGVPGEYGAVYNGLLAVMRTVVGPTCSYRLAIIGYTQAASVADGKVDAAVGYSNNEPILLERRGIKINVIEVSGVANLVGASIVGGISNIAHNYHAFHEFVLATQRGLYDTIRHPREAFSIARTVHGLTTLRGRDVADQYAVLTRSIDFWKSKGTAKYGLGYMSAPQWRTSMSVLRSLGEIKTLPTLPDLYTNIFIWRGPRA